MILLLSTIDAILHRQFVLTQYKHNILVAYARFAMVESFDSTRVLMHFAEYGSQMFWEDVFKQLGECDIVVDCQIGFS